VFICAPPRRPPLAIACRHARRVTLTIQDRTQEPPIVAAHFGHGIALFDLDRTLVPGSSLVALGRELLRRRLIDRQTLARHAVSAAAFRRRGLSDDEVDRVRRGLLLALAGRETAPILGAVAAVGRRVAADVYPSARWLLGRHLDAGDFCVVLTASPQELADAVVAALGAHRAVGTRLQVLDGRFTGAIDGPFCYGAGKIRRLEAEVGALDFELATAYGDSASDLDVLSHCGAPVAVNPDRRLLGVARGRGWPVLRFE
jgi:HAD superfamily hydrolase (TIGR01490 family)